MEIQRPRKNEEGMSSEEKRERCMGSTAEVSG